VGCEEAVGRGALLVGEVAMDSSAGALTN